MVLYDKVSRLADGALALNLFYDLVIMVSKMGYNLLKLSGHIMTHCWFDYWSIA